MTFFSICIILGVVHVSLLSGESVISVSGDLGSTAVLNCKLKSVGAEPHIRWSTDSEIVFEREGESCSQGEGYEDRVDVPVDELRKGNCSLVLRNLQPNDKNVYTCSHEVRVYKRDTRVITKFKEISRVSLSVGVKPPEEKSDEVSSPTDDAQMKNPHPLILVLSLLACVLFQSFLREP